MFEGKKILVTGGTGSFGHAFVRLTLEKWSKNRNLLPRRNEAMGDGSKMGL